MPRSPSAAPRRTASTTPSVTDDLGCLVFVLNVDFQSQEIVNQMTALSMTHSGRPNQEGPTASSRPPTGSAARGSTTCWRGEGDQGLQETWLRYQAAPTQPTSTKVFLPAVVTRISIAVLRSARFRRETYVGQWLPSRCSPTPTRVPARSAELADSVSMAALLLLERAVFVLREGFGFSFSEIAPAVCRSEVACRPARGAGHAATWTPDDLGFEADTVADAWAAAREANQVRRPPR